MKLSSSILVAAFLALGVSAAPVAQADAVAIASPEAKAEAQAIAAPFAEAQPEASADLLSGLSGLTNIATGLGSITGILTNLANVLSGSGLPTADVQNIVKIVVNLVEGIVGALGSGNGLNGITTTINNLLDQALNSLDGLLTVTDLDSATDALLNKVVTQVKEILTTLVATLLGILGSLLSFNLLGLVTTLLTGILTILGQLLSAL